MTTARKFRTQFQTSALCAFSATLLLAAAALTGCGATPMTCGSTVIPASTNNGGSTIQPATTLLNIYPGQTEALEVGVGAPAGTTTTVSMTGLPSGMTVTPAQITGTGSTSLNITSTVSLASECFTGALYVFSTTYPVEVTATSSAGTSTFGVLLNVGLQNQNYLPTSTNIPKLSITTNSGQFVIAKDTYLPGAVTISDSVNSANNYTGTMQVKGHGNSTFSMPKTPYALKLDNKASLIGMASAKNWVLLANYDDKSLIRDSLASSLGKMFGMPWTYSTQPVELYFNKIYEGTYLLAEKIEINTNRLNLVVLPSTDTPTEDVTGGYLLEIDQRRDETFVMTTPQGLPIGNSDPDPLTPNQQTYIQPTLFAAENSLFATNFTDATKGWRSSYDEFTAINWYLVEELMGNGDADFFSSVYLYKNADNPLFYMGPLWDFDISTGNVNYSAAGSPDVPWVRTQAPWYHRWFEDASFLADVKTRWTAMRTQVGTVPAIVDTLSNQLILASQNNYARWPTIGEKVWPNQVAEGTYAGEIDYLKKWLTARIAFLDSLYLNQ